MTTATADRLMAKMGNMTDAELIEVFRLAKEKGASPTIILALLAEITSRKID